MGGKYGEQGEGIRRSQVHSRGQSSPPGMPQHFQCLARCARLWLPLPTSPAPTPIHHASSGMNKTLTS